MSSGSFTGSTSNQYIQPKITWSSTLDRSKNTSSVTVTLSYSRTNSGYTTKGTWSGSITINGTQYSGSKYLTITQNSNTTAITKTVTITHDANGSKTVQISATGSISGTTLSSTSISGSATLDTNTVYTLTVNAGSGSSITVTRTSSGYAGTGVITNNAKLYYGDILKITFAANANHALITHTVNGSSFTSGNSHTVSANVTVASSAQVLASSVGASNANIGSVSTITVTKYNSSYYHSLHYSFGTLSGYITAAGGVSSEEAKFSQTSVAFTVPNVAPNDFYSQIPNAKTGVCTITCRTYQSASSTTVLGSATTCTFTVTASQSECAPTVTGTVTDTNATTVALTGDSSKLVKFMSTAECTISATPKNSATISSQSINGVTPTNNVVTVNNVAASSFVFSATDSRGYSSSYTGTPTIVPYVALTCNPIISRPTPTGSSIEMTFSGNYYNGSFGAYSNTLTIQYRYKEGSGSYGSWETIPAGSIIYGTSTYSSSAAVSLGNSFNYLSDYTFQINAYDGANGYTLSSVTQTASVARGIPVFDWGRDDFNVNGVLKVNGESIMQIKKGEVYDNTAHTTQIPSGSDYKEISVTFVDGNGVSNPFASTPTVMLTEWTTTTTQQNVCMLVLTDASASGFTFRIWRQYGSANTTQPEPAIHWVAFAPYA